MILFALHGITAQPDPIPFPMILGNDGAGTLEDGTPVVIYPVMGSDEWRDDETLDPRWHVLSERVPGTFADYVAVPSCNAIGADGLSPNICIRRTHQRPPLHYWGRYSSDEAKCP
jgi:hypothetical protein